MNTEDKARRWLPFFPWEVTDEYDEDGERIRRQVEDCNVTFQFLPSGNPLPGNAPYTIAPGFYFRSDIQVRGDRQNRLLTGWLFPRKELFPFLTRFAALPSVNGELFGMYKRAFVNAYVYKDENLPEREGQVVYLPLSRFIEGAMRSHLRRGVNLFNPFRPHLVHMNVSAEETGFLSYTFSVRPTPHSVFSEDTIEGMMERAPDLNELPRKHSDEDVFAAMRRAFPVKWEAFLQKERVRT